MTKRLLVGMDGLRVVDTDPIRGVVISEDLFRTQRSIATRTARYRRLKKLQAPEFVIKKEEELIEQAIENLVDHPDNMWEGRDLDLEGPPAERVEEEK
jgi:hypothetical protein